MKKAGKPFHIIYCRMCGKNNGLEIYLEAFLK